MTTTNNKRIETMAKVMGAAIAKLRKTDPALAIEVSNRLQLLVAEVKAGRL